MRLCKDKISRRALIDLRAGRSRPRGKTRETLEMVLKKILSVLQEPKDAVLFPEKK
jgi:hypothetical protein